jgi:hypothetical protein
MILLPTLFALALSSSTEKMSGGMSYAGDSYEVDCVCGEDAMERVEEEKCHPSKTKISLERDGNGAS